MKTVGSVDFPLKASCIQVYIQVEYVSDVLLLTCAVWTIESAFNLIWPNRAQIQTYNAFCTIIYAKRTLATDRCG